MFENIALYANFCRYIRTILRFTRGGCGGKNSSHLSQHATSELLTLYPELNCALLRRKRRFKKALQFLQSIPIFFNQSSGYSIIVEMAYGIFRHCDFRKRFCLIKVYPLFHKLKAPFSAL